MINIYPFVGAAVQENGESTFTVWAPFRKKVTLSVSAPQAASYEMQRDEQGYWHVTLPVNTSGLRYQYLLDDELLRPDPASRCQPEGVHGPSEVAPSDSFTWSDNGWTGLELAEMIIYELHTGTFTSTQDFKGIISKLEYLRSLGVNAIEIMPVAQFPGNRNWGYDGVYPFAVQNTYGGVKGLKELVNAAHQHGIAVILDVVYNHLGPEGNYFADYGPYFTGKYKTPWGPAINFDDAWCDGVRGYYLQNALMWLHEFHIDGLRVDAVHAIWDCGARHFTEELSAATDALQEETGRKKILIAEIDYNSPRYITPREKGGYGMHGQWTDEFHHALHAALTKETNGYYADFGGLSPLAKSLRDSYVFTGQYSTVRKRNFGLPVQQIPYSRFVVFTQNHDQTGNRMHGDRLSTLVTFEALKLAAAVMLLSPHVPMLFMGEEYGEKNPFQFFTSHSDPQLIAALQQGRKEEFASFSWEGEVPDPQSTGTFNRSVLSWDTSPASAALIAYYRYLIAFRKTRRALLHTDRAGTFVHPLQADDKILVMERSGNDDHLLLIFNFSDEKVTYQNTQAVMLRKKFDSAAAVWLGPGTEAPEETATAGGISLTPFSALVYEIV